MAQVMSFFRVKRLRQVFFCVRLAGEKIDPKKLAFFSYIYKEVKKIKEREVQE